jgi:hypothetical protein
MTHTVNYDRPTLVKELALSFGKASGYTANVSDVNQWELTADAIIRTIEGIVEYKLRAASEAKPPYRDDKE